MAAKRIKALVRISIYYKAGEALVYHKDAKCKRLRKSTQYTFDKWDYIDPTKPKGEQKICGCLK